MEYITPAKCEEYRNEINKKVELNKDEMIEVKVLLKTTIAFLKVIGGAVCAGIVSIIIILLTRGL